MISNRDQDGIWSDCRFIVLPPSVRFSTWIIMLAEPGRVLIVLLFQMGTISLIGSD